MAPIGAWVVIAALLPGFGPAQDPPGVAPPLVGQRRWDVFPDTWVATDGLGRSLPTHAQVGARRADKTVGIFYFLWLGQHGDQGPFDISKILAQDPTAMRNPDSPLWGPPGAPHHWGESIFGYYVSDDEAVLRKHAQMLADAGVDVVVFDVTNQLTYPRSWRALCRVFDRARRAGNRVPQIAFLCPFSSPRKVVRELWEQLYSRELYPELWFRWEGRPLILADPALLGESINPHDERDRAIRRFFTFRKPQPDYFAGPTGPEQWGWLEVYPQHAFYNKPGAAEEVTVGIAQNATDGRLSVLSHPRSRGRSFHDGKQPGPSDCGQCGGQDTSGQNFAEQWRRALQIDPRFIFITGWNEWIAGRFDRNAPFYGAGPVNFVDQFNQEYSRDIEPMRGGHGDNYYYQMVAAIRRYKGARPLPPVESRRIVLDGRFDDWQEVAPEYRDTIGDPVSRDHPGWGRQLHYANQTGRNDLVAAKVSCDERHVYFYVRTLQPRLPAGDPGGTLLLVDADCNPATGWLGYDVIVNRTVVSTDNGGGDSVIMERNVEGRYQWDSPLPVACRAAGEELELAIPRSALGQNSLPVTIDYKWTDNIRQTGEWSDFTLNGDVAPNDRFNYRAHLPAVAKREATTP